MDRRRFLAAAMAAGVGALAVPRLAHASKSASKIAAIDRGRAGTTFKLALAHAPFPCAGGSFVDPTVFVFVPRHYRAPDDDAVDMVVHFHGHNTTAERALAAHALREQLADSKQNAILVVPQGAVMAPESGVGKLAARGGLRRLLVEVTQVLCTRDAEDALGPAATPKGAKLGTLCLSAHSGGYTSVASCIAHGGARVSEVYLFDALYGEVAAYRDWILAAKDASARGRHKLVSYYVGERVRALNMELLNALEAAGIHCLHESAPGELSRSEMTRGRAIFLRSSLNHGEVTSELNGFRDCLYASCLHRRIDTDWFERRSGPRHLEARIQPTPQRRR